MKFKEILFWLHIALVIGFLLMGLYLPLSIIILVIVLHKTQMLVFHGCLLTRIQKALGHIPEKINFMQVVAKKLFNRKITRNQGIIVDYSLTLLTLMIAVINKMVIVR